MRHKRWLRGHRGGDWLVAAAMAGHGIEAMQRIGRGKRDGKLGL